MAAGRPLPRRWAIAVYVSVAAHGMWALLTIWLFVVASQESTPGWWPRKAPPLDMVHVAAQMGRLDLLALVLAGLGLTLAIAAFGGFFLLRSAAVNAAHDEAEHQMDRRGSRWIEDYMKANGDQMVSGYLESNLQDVRRTLSLALSPDDASIDADAIIQGLDQDEHSR